MAQRINRDRVFGIIPREDYEDRHPADERALERIKFDVSEWDRMNWYVKLANMDFDKLTEGERLSLREEFWGIKHTLWLDKDNPEPIANEIKGIQRNVAKHLSELADQGKTEFGPFHLRITVECPVVEFKEMYQDLRPEHLRQMHGGHHDTDLISGGGFLYYMTQLLQEFGGSIRRCPHCNKIFLQARKNAVYCTRKCQSVAFMRQKRAAAKEKVALKRGRARSLKRRLRHGKTRR